MTLSEAANARIDEIGRRWLDLEDKRETLVAEQETIKAELRQLYIDGAASVTHETAHVKVTVMANRRFDETLARKVLEPPVASALSESRISARKAKAMLVDEVYEQCLKVVGEPKVVIR